MHFLGKRNVDAQLEYFGITFACLFGAIVSRRLVLTSLPESGMAGLCGMACD